MALTDVLCNQIICGDCLEGMKQMKPNSVELILSDIPSGKTQDSWDVVLSLDDLWAGYRSILKPDGVVLLMAQFPYSLTVGVSNCPWLDDEWFWFNPESTRVLSPGTYPTIMMGKHENVLVYIAPGGESTWNPQMIEGRSPTNGLFFGFDARDQGGKLHPVQKPVGLFEYLIQTYSNPGELVFDGCMGSGTTAIACLNTGRNYIGLEKDREIFDRAQNRVRNWKPQSESV
jgi:site-specific DNA-methyltransferase (adenine-specific)